MSITASQSLRGHQRTHRGEFSNATQNIFIEKWKFKKKSAGKFS